MKIIKIENNDLEIEKLSKLATEIVRDYYDPIIGKEQNDYMLEKFQSVNGIKKQIENGYEYFYIYIEEIKENIGFIGLCPEEKKMFLSKFYIKKQFRNKGYGKKTFEFITEYSNNLKKDSIYLTVNRNNTDTIEKYYALGLKKIDEKKTDIGNGYFMDDYIMSYCLV